MTRWWRPRPQTMTGGEGADTFVIGEGRINATITDFTLGVDKLQFENAGKYGSRDLHVRRDHGNSLSPLVTTKWCCKGVDPHHVSPHDLNNLLV